MRTTIDRAGRVVVPKAIRDRLRLLGGGQVEITEHGGVIEMVPLPARVDIIEGPDGPVAVAVDALPPLTDQDVTATIDAVRR